MQPRRLTLILKDPVWAGLISYSVILFFIYLGDAILSFWVPNLLQNALGDARGMGLIISFSSLIGFLLDLLFPQAIQDITVKRLTIWGAVAGMSFAGVLLVSLKLPLVLIFLVAMGIWGIYYNFLSYSGQQFISDTMPVKSRSGGWAVFSAFKNIAYLVGPLLAAWLLVRGEWIPAAIDIFLLTLGLMLILFMKKVHDRPLTINLKNVNIWAEIGHWRALIDIVWPIVILSLLLGTIDAVFWTTGTVLTENLTKQNFWGSFFLPMYQLPSLFIGLIMAKMSFSKGKKRLAIILLIISAMFLSLIGFVSQIFLVLAVVLVSSILLAFVYPLVNGVYTDLITRMGRKREHMVVLSDSTSNLGYVIGPVFAGFVSSWVGEEKTFSVIGIIVIFVSVLLLIFTPKKLRLPETEIDSWKN